MNPLDPHAAHTRCPSPSQHIPASRPAALVTRPEGGVMCEGGRRLMTWDGGRERGGVGWPEKLYINWIFGFLNLGNAWMRRQIVEDVLVTIKGTQNQDSFVFIEENTGDYLPWLESDQWCKDQAFFVVVKINVAFFFPRVQFPNQSKAMMKRMIHDRKRPAGFVHAILQAASCVWLPLLLRIQKLHLDVLKALCVLKGALYPSSAVALLLPGREEEKKSMMLLFKDIR